MAKQQQSSSVSNQAQARQGQQQQQPVSGNPQSAQTVQPVQQVARPLTKAEREVEFLRLAGESIPPAVVGHLIWLLQDSPFQIASMLRRAVLPPFRASVAEVEQIGEWLNQVVHVRYRGVVRIGVEQAKATARLNDKAGGGTRQIQSAGGNVSGVVARAPATTAVSPVPANVSSAPAAPSEDFADI